MTNLRPLLRVTAHALLAVLMSLVVLLAAPPPASAAATAVVDDAGCRAGTLAANDDGSTAEQPMGFGVDFFGTTYTGVFVNNNGDVTFGTPFSGYTGLDLAGAGIPIVAVAFYDVDTRAGGSQPVRYGQTTFEGRQAFCVNWLDVGYYSMGTDRLNRSQLLIVDRSDTGPGNVDLVMNYDRIVYDDPVGLTVGYSNGSDVSYTLPGSGVQGAFLDANQDSGLIHGSAGSSVPGRYVYAVRGGRPAPPGEDPSPAPQTIEFPTPAPTAVGAPPIEIAASASSGLPVTIAAEGPCAVSGTTVTVTGAGDCTLSATQPGDDAFAPADPVTRVLSIAKGAATLVVDGLSATYDGEPRPVDVRTVPPGLDGVSLTYDGETQPPTHAGTYAVEARLDHADWAAVPATATLVVGPAGQTVTFPPPGDASYGDDPLPLAATASSGLPVGYTTSGPCTVVDGALRLDGAGTCAVTASQDGDGDHQAAPSVVETVTIARAAQTITFPLPSEARLGQNPVVLAGEASSGLPVAYQADGRCVVHDGALSFTGAGTCHVSASQAGDADHLPAEPVERDVSVPKLPASLALSALRQQHDGQPRPVTVTTSPQGLEGVTVTYDGDSFPPRAVGRYEVVATLDHELFTATPVTATLVVAAPPAVVVPPKPKPTPPPPKPKPTPAPTVRPTPPATSTPTRPVVTPGPVAPRPVTAPAAPRPVPVEGALPELPPGSTVALVSGARAPVATVPEGTRLTVQGAGFRASVGALDERGEAAPLTAEGHVRLHQGQQVAVEGSGFAPGSQSAVWLFSTPRLLGTVVVGADGGFSRRLPVPDDLPAGRHTLQMNGTAAGGGERSVSLGVRVDDVSAATPSALGGGLADGLAGPGPLAGPSAPDDGGLQLLSATPDGVSAPASEGTAGDLAVSLPSLATVPAPRAGSTPGPAVDAEGEDAAFAAYDPLSDVPGVVSAQVALFALLALSGAAAAPRAASTAGVTGSPGGGGRRKGKVTSAKVKHHKFRWEGDARGDRSRTWRWPGTAALDAVTLALPLRLAPVSPLLARVAVDGAYLRAMLGSAAALLPLAGVVLGGVAVASSGGAALPPATALVVAIAVLGVADAAAGVLAVLVFVAGVALGGGIDSADAVRTLLGLASLWFAAPLIAGAARPLRRPADADGHRTWDRVGDVTIATLIGGWAVQKMVGALPGLSGLELPIAAHADTIAVIVMAALVARTGAEEVAARWYPARLAAVAPQLIPFSGTPQRLAATALRTALFVFVAVAFIGWCWQLVVGTALFVAPQVASIYERRFPNLPRLHAVLPRGVTKVVAMIVVGTVAGAIVVRVVTDPARALADSFVLLALPGFVLSWLGLVGREGDSPRLTWSHQLAGAALVLGATALVVVA